MSDAPVSPAVNEAENENATPVINEVPPTPEVASSAPEAAVPTTPADVDVAAEAPPTSEAAPVTPVDVANVAAEAPAAPRPRPASSAAFDALKVGQALQGTVKRIELYGAFVDVGVGRDGLLHISQLGQPNVRNVEDVVKAGDTPTVYVLKVDKEAGRIQLSLEKPPAVSWDTLNEGDVVTGTVTRVEQFGAFIDIGAERDGMIHVSELAAGYVNAPSDIVKVGDEIQAKIIKLNKKKKRIDLSKKALEVPERPTAREIARIVEDEVEADDEPAKTALQMAFERAQEGEPKSSGRGDRRDYKREKRDRERRDMEDIYERTLRNNR